MEFVDENVSDEEVFDDDEPEEEWLEEWLNESDEDEGEDNQHTENYVTDPQSENILSRKLRMWALSHRITHTAINDLLGIIRETTEYYVPKDVSENSRERQTKYYHSGRRTAMVPRDRKDVSVPF